VKQEQNMPTIQKLFDEKLKAGNKLKCITLNGTKWELSKGKTGPYHFHFKCDNTPDDSMAWIEPDCILLSDTSPKNVVAIEVCTNWQNFDGKRYLYNRVEKNSLLRMHCKSDKSEKSKKIEKSTRRDALCDKDWNLEKIIYVVTDKKSRGKINYNPAHSREHFLVCKSKDTWWKNKNTWNAFAYFEKGKTERMLYEI
jgi:hypothetical protein